LRSPPRGAQLALPFAVWRRSHEGAGLRSLFVGFETLDDTTLRLANKRQNLGRDYARAIRRLDDLGVMVNGSFVFGLDGHGPDVFDRTVDWAVA
jgi:radical SAM superfamily enzyme YgiQ (UPF0313 family)